MLNAFKMLAFCTGHKGMGIERKGEKLLWSLESGNGTQPLFYRCSDRFGGAGMMVLEVVGAEVGVETATAVIFAVVIIIVAPHNHSHISTILFTF